MVNDKKVYEVGYDKQGRPFIKPHIEKDSKGNLKVFLPALGKVHKLIQENKK